jgi:flagellar hook protein FlgE
MKTDLAIQGPGFFILSDGTATTADATGALGELRGYDTADDALVDVYGAGGSTLGLDLGDGSTGIVIGGELGGGEIAETVLAVDAGTTVGDLMAAIQQAFSISSRPVAMNEQGQIVVQGEVGTAAAIGSIRLGELDSDNDLGALSFTSTQAARDQRTFQVSTLVYDSLGGEHTITFDFQKVPDQNEWIWEAEMEGGEQIVSGGSGRLRFDEHGAITGFTYDDGAGGVTFRPQDADAQGAAPVTVSIDYGDVGGLNGLTQFEGRSSLMGTADGYTAGSLVDFEIDQSGLIVGRFSNDTLRNIGRVALAQFSNEAGLVRQSNNTYAVTMGSPEFPVTA